MGLYLGKEKISNVASVITQNADSMATEIQNHIANSDIHITDDERTKWNTVTEMQNHITDTDIHITADERTKWNAAADKSTEGSTEVSLPVDVEILETICENIEFTKANNTYTFPTPITINSDGLYYISYSYYKDNVFDEVNSGYGFSKPQTINNELSVQWLSDISTNSIIMTASKIVDTWVIESAKAIVSIYKVNIIINDRLKKAALLQEGYNNIVSGDWAHAEGKNNVARGISTHVEGQDNIASYDYTHVQGKHNMTGNYAHIVGNGTSTKRSNAHVLDWSGNAWFAGDVYVNGVPGQAGTPKKLATEVPVSTADNGKVLSVVNGAWAAAAMSSGAYIGSYVGNGASSKTLTFNFKPGMIIMLTTGDYSYLYISVRGCNKIDRIGGGFGGGIDQGDITWNNTSIVLTSNDYCSISDNKCTYYYAVIPAMN